MRNAVSLFTRKMKCLDAGNVWKCISFHSRGSNLHNNHILSISSFFFKSVPLTIHFFSNHPFLLATKDLTDGKTQLHSTFLKHHGPRLLQRLGTIRRSEQERVEVRNQSLGYLEVQDT